MPPRTLEEVGEYPCALYSQHHSNNLSEDTDATNELINDGEFVQPLTLEEIEALKLSGVHASVMNSSERGIHILTAISGYYQEANRTTCQLFPENRIQ